MATCCVLCSAQSRGDGDLPVECTTALLLHRVDYSFGRIYGRSAPNGYDHVRAAVSERFDAVLDTSYWRVLADFEEGGAVRIARAEDGLHFLYDVCLRRSITSATITCNL